jgi:pyrroloquinoline quinone biosynthesis protein B
MLEQFNRKDPWLMVLGTAQDGGFPQANCQDLCCQRAWKNQTLRRSPACLAIIDPVTQKRWLIDCSQDFPAQLHRLNNQSDPRWGLDGIFLTHAHIGHYAGLINLGREVIASKELPLFAMPRMKSFLEGNSPWNLLNKQGHTKIEPIFSQETISLSKDLTITPILVPHRDELSETVGFKIDGPKKSAIYIPDIDSWKQWDVNIEALLSSVDIAWLDGTFYNADELPNRNLKLISHPFVQDTMAYFSSFASNLREKVHFIHLNHSNPLCDPNSYEKTLVQKMNFSIASENDCFIL